MLATADFNIRSLKLYSRDSDRNDSDDERNDIIDLGLVPEILVVKRKEDRFYQLLPIDDGIYDGTVNEQMSREGLGTFSSNNGEKYHLGRWENDKPCGYGYQFDKHGSIIYYGKFDDTFLREGYGELKLDNGYLYEGKIKNNKFHGLGSLSIRIDGLKQIDNREIEKYTLKLVADWENGKTKTIYSNEINVYYKYQYQVFINSLSSMSSLNNENQQKQRTYFQNLINLLNDSYSNIDLLKQIASPVMLFPAELQSSADILVQLDSSYSNLKEYTEIDEKESYKKVVRRLCQIGLTLYARKLAWIDYDDKFGGISPITIFDNSLEAFINKTSLSEMGEVLLINPLVVDLIHKMIRYANVKVIQIPLQYRSFFTNIHNSLIKNIWKNYFENFKRFPDTDPSSSTINDKYQFYADCYSILIELPLLSEFKMKINIYKSTNRFLKIEIDENIIFDSMKTDSDLKLILIVLDGGTGAKKINELFSTTDYDRLNNKLKSSMIDNNDIVVFALLNSDTSRLSSEYKKVFSQLGSTDIENAKGKISWIFVGKKAVNGKIDERILTDTNHDLVIQKIVRLDIREEYRVKVNSAKKDIESAIFEAMKFSLDHLKPWKNFLIDELKSYLHKSIDPNASTKDIGDQLLMKILEKTKSEIAILFAKKTQSFIDTLKSLISYYEDSLLKDKNSNYQAKMKSIIKIVDYLVQVSLFENACAQETIDSQLATIKAFIEEKETIMQIIDRFLSFNDELLKLIDILNTHFSSEKHKKFYEMTSEIVSTVQKIFCKMLTLWKNGVDSNSSSVGYSASDLESALQKMNDFLTNLRSLDFTWFVEGRHIRELKIDLFEKVPDKDLYKVLDIERGRANFKTERTHYVLDAITELLQIVNDGSNFDSLHSNEGIRIRAELLISIAKSFKYFTDQIKYSDLSRFKEDCVQPFRDAISKCASYETLCIRLEKLEFYFLYNRKLKEITVDRALELFSSENKNKFNVDTIKSAFSTYESSFNGMFSKIIKERMLIKDVVEETKQIAQENKFQRSKIPEIIAGLSVILSLTVSNFIGKDGGGNYVLKSEFNKEYLLQPHCIQILGVLILLGSDGNQNSIPDNHIAEILTGQGKSWALGLIAGYFSLTNYRVTVACYSNYLTKRDEAEFKKNFDPFNFSDSVEYQTLESMCAQALTNRDYNKKLKDLIIDLVSGNDLSFTSNPRSVKKNSVLLIDEIDVFFSEKFGTTYDSSVRVFNSNIAEVQKQIWKMIASGKTNKEELKILVTEQINSFTSADTTLLLLKESGLLENQLDKMIDAAIKIYDDMNSQKRLRNQYKIIDDRICLKGDDDKYYSNRFNQYENSFYYLKLIYKKFQSFEQVSLKTENFGYFLVRCGQISYSELPNSYDRIFGVSGTLRSLTDKEKFLLAKYKIEKTSYYPSFFGGSKLQFSEIDNFIIKACKKDWFSSIVIQTRQHINQERSVLIFFNDEELLIEFYKLYSGDLGVDPFYITQNMIFDGKKDEKYSDERVNQLIKEEYAGHHGNVTLLTRQFGRGVDFQAEAKVNEKGGIHIIQTFFSVDIKEEIQIKGRTARKDDPGSYELILCLEHLEVPNLSQMGDWKFKKVVEGMTYDELNTQRNEIVNSFCNDKLKQIENNKNLHEKTLSFFRKAMTECNNNNRLQFLRELKGL